MPTIMNVADLKRSLSQYPAAHVRFLLPKGDAVPAHAHVTEVARIDKRFIDCGGDLHHDSRCRLQTWFANDVKTNLKLADRGKLHFDNWDKELAVIQNEAIRASGQARKLELQSRFDSVRNTCLNVATSFTPVQSDLSDLRRVLNSDLNTSGLAAIRDNATRVTQQATPVRQSIGNLVTELRSLGVAMSPQNRAAPAALK